MVNGLTYDSLLAIVLMAGLIIAVLSTTMVPRGDQQTRTESSGEGEPTLAPVPVVVARHSAEGQRRS